MHRLLFTSLCIFCVAILASGCGPENNRPVAEANVSGEPADVTAAHNDAAAPSEQFPVRLTVSHLPNAVQVHQKVISGGQPAGEAAFLELRNLGVRTVISVDGAAPNLELAKKYGLRYVHLPHGYDGISEQRVRELAKAVRDFDGPIYIHCHHGKHRSPAAAAVACISAGLIEKSQAAAILTVAGTDRNYRGLYDVAESAVKLDHSVMETIESTFPETAALPPAAEAMVALECTQDRLKILAASGWKTPESHPDLTGSHEALLLREHFAEMLRAEWVHKEDDAFRALLNDSEAAASDLELALRRWEDAEAFSEVPEIVPLSFDRISKSCTACHQQFRDVPLSEKSGFR